jgi:hypothetical protein
MPRVEPDNPATADDSLPPGWAARDVTFVMEGATPALSRRITLTAAPCLGPLALSRARNTTWQITHVPTGRWACRGLEARDDAIRIAAALMAHGAVGLGKLSPGEITAACPAWFAPWIDACQKAGKYVDPPSNH